MKSLIATLALLTMPLLAYADHCRSRVVAVKQVVAVQHVAAVATYAAPIIYPVYSASYNSEAAGIIEELRKLREELRQAQRGEPAQALAFDALLAQRCAACHQDGKAEANGGGFVLVEKDGTIPPFSLGEKRSIERSVAEGRMPPRTPLADREKQVFAQAFRKKD